MDRFLILLLLFPIFFSPEQVFGQVKDYPFKNGEYARYGAYFNWHFIWIQSGDVEFKADSVYYNQQNAWHLKAIGKTYKAYDLLYPVRDTFDVFCNYDTFNSLYSRRVINHAKNISEHRYTFDYSAGKIATTIKQEKKPLFYTSLPIQENTFDLLFFSG